MKAIKTILMIIVLIILIAMLWIYWFVGFEQVNLSLKPQNNNFTLGVYNSTNMQFYENLRFPNKEISYKISNDCTLQKKYDAERAFEILGNITILNFYKTENNEEILVNCDSKEKIEGDFFIAGEGGPVNITRAGKFNVILYGEILLIRQSDCPNPNIAIHEILHVLGFNHSTNVNNIMYPISKCYQTIGQNIPDLINELYSIPSYPDLSIEEVSPNIKGKYLDLNMSIKNNGLKDSQEAVVEIYMDDEFLESIDIESLEIGYGVKFALQNIKLTKTNFDELKFIVKTNFEEIDKKNNEVIFEVQK